MTTKKRSAPRKGLDDLRQRIDEINLTLVDLLSERAQLAQEIGRVKHAEGTPIHQPARERQVFERVFAHNPGPLTEAHLQRIFTEIISACTALEQRIRIAFLGPEHTYSHEAARGRFGGSGEFLPEPSISAVFQALDAERADYGVVPVENSTEGSVGLTLDLLIDTPATIVGEILLPIRHALMSRDGYAAKIRRILSHQQSLGQCRNFLAVNYPRCELEAVASNALAAQHAAEDETAAAICSAAAAEAYGLRIIAENVQDLAHNVTRFLVLGRHPTAHSGKDKTSLLFALPERAGVLHRALSLFARDKINLTMIQSRPQRERPWAYLFFVDLEGHREDPRVKRALATLQRQALFLKVLGSYPEGRLSGAKTQTRRPRERKQ
ncbi:MAG TPA: prephenate dehydratase [Candidatus Binataceae bacterium]|nr:prephenate dehydratase [Candidatus Binataceae bacterium]